MPKFTKGKAKRGNFRKRKQVKKKPYKARALIKTIQREIHRVDEVKQYVAPEVIGLTCYNNTMYTFAPHFSGPQLGTAQNNRTGNQIFLRHIRMRGFIRGNTSTTMECYARCIALWSPLEWSGLTSGLLTPSTFQNTDIFINSYSNGIFGMIDNKKDVEVVFDKTWKVTNHLGAAQVYQGSRQVDIHLPIMKKLTYVPSGTFWTNRNLYFVWIMFGPNLTAGTDIPGYMDLQPVLTYQDS